MINQISLNTAFSGIIQVVAKDSSGNGIASNTNVLAIIPTTTPATATGTLSNNGFDNPGVQANYDFTLNLVNKVPSGG